MWFGWSDPVSVKVTHFSDNILLYNMFTRCSFISEHSHAHTRNFEHERYLVCARCVWNIVHASALGMICKWTTHLYLIFKTMCQPRFKKQKERGVSVLELYLSGIKYRCKFHSIKGLWEQQRGHSSMSTVCAGLHHDQLFLWGIIIWWLISFFFPLKADLGTNKIEQTENKNIPHIAPKKILS